MRRNFPKSVQVARFKLCGGLCEGIKGDGTRCNAVLRRGHWECDHAIADGLGGKPTLENARCLCEDCHSLKTKKDLEKIAKVKRIEANEIGAKMPKKKLESRDFKKSDKKPKIDKAMLPVLPRVSLYTKV